MTNKKYAILVLGMIIIFPSLAQAASPIGNIGSAVVNEGAAVTDFRFGYTAKNDGGSNDDRLQMRQHFDYGLTDWYALRLVVAQDKRKHDNLEHKGVTLENRLQLIERRDYGWDGGIRLQYTHSDGDKTPHELDFRLLALVPLGESWEWRHNTVIEHDIGENSRHGLQLELRNQVAMKIKPFVAHMKKVAVGIEMFNDFGRIRDVTGYDHQDHQLGPVFKSEFGNGTTLQLGYRTGISQDAADHSFKIFVGQKF